MSFKKIEEFVNQHHMITPNTTIILGLSGGPDSLYLLYFLHTMQKKVPFSIVAAHLDHQWRPNSNQDMLLCKKVCEKLKITFETTTISALPFNGKEKGSKEDLARQYRRAFFDQLKKKYNADVIAIAHTEDDQIETFFIRLMRGATVSGLAAIRPQSENYIRPLLQVTKKEILNYLKRNRIPYALDPTNTSTQFLRNRIRINLIPVLKKIDSRAEKNLLKTIDSMQETEVFLKNLAQKALIEISAKKEPERHIFIEKFLKQDAYLQRRVLLEWLYEAKVPFNISTGLIEEILRFMNNKKSNIHQFDTWFIKKKKNMIYILKTK